MVVKSLWNDLTNKGMEWVYGGSGTLSSPSSTRSNPRMSTSSSADMSLSTTPSSSESSAVESAAAAAEKTRTAAAAPMSSSTTSGRSRGNGGNGGGGGGGGGYWSYAGDSLQSVWNSTTSSISGAVSSVYEYSTSGLSSPTWQRGGRGSGKGVGASVSSHAERGNDNDNNNNNGDGFDGYDDGYDYYDDVDDDPWHRSQKNGHARRGGVLQTLTERRQTRRRRNTLRITSRQKEEEQRQQHSESGGHAGRTGSGSSISSSLASSAFRPEWDWIRPHNPYDVHHIQGRAHYNPSSLSAVRSLLALVPTEPPATVAVVAPLPPTPPPPPPSESDAISSPPPSSVSKRDAIPSSSASLSIPATIEEFRGDHGHDGEDEDDDDDDSDQEDDQDDDQDDNNNDDRGEKRNKTRKSNWKKVNPNRLGLSGPKTPKRQASISDLDENLAYMSPKTPPSRGRRTTNARSERAPAAAAAWRMTANRQSAAETASQLAEGTLRALRDIALDEAIELYDSLQFWTIRWERPLLSWLEAGPWVWFAGMGGIRGIWRDVKSRTSPLLWRLLRMLPGPDRFLPATWHLPNDRLGGSSRRRRRQHHRHRRHDHHPREGENSVAGSVDETRGGGYVHHEVGQKVSQIQAVLARRCTAIGELQQHLLRAGWQKGVAQWGVLGQGRAQWAAVAGFHPTVVAAAANALPYMPPPPPPPPPPPSSHRRSAVELPPPPPLHQERRGVETTTTTGSHPPDGEGPLATSERTLDESILLSSDSSLVFGKSGGGGDPAAATTAAEDFAGDAASAPTTALRRSRRRSSRIEVKAPPQRERRRVASSAYYGNAQVVVRHAADGGRIQMDDPALAAWSVDAMRLVRKLLYRAGNGETAIPYAHNWDPLVVDPPSSSSSPGGAAAAAAAGGLDLAVGSCVDNARASSQWFPKWAARIKRPRPRTPPPPPAAVPLSPTTPVLSKHRINDDDDALRHRQREQRSREQPPSASQEEGTLVIPKTVDEGGDGVVGKGRREHDKKERYGAFADTSDEDDDDVVDDDDDDDAVDVNEGNMNNEDGVDDDDDVEYDIVIQDLPLLAAEVEQLLDTLEVVMEIQRHRRLERLRGTPRWRRHWYMVAAALPAVSYILVKWIRHGSTGRQVAAFVAQKLSDFVKEHVSAPLRAIYMELFGRSRRETISDHKARREAIASLKKMIRSWLDETYPAMDRAERKSRAENMDMSLIERRKEANMKTIYEINSVVRMSLIEMQFIKKEMMNAMFAMDEMMTSNEINMNLAAVTPAVLILYAIRYTSRFMFYVLLKLGKSREEVFSNFRHVILDLERLLTMRDNPPLVPPPLGTSILANNRRMTTITTAAAGWLPRNDGRGEPNIVGTGVGGGEGEGGGLRGNSAGGGGSSSDGLLNSDDLGMLMLHIHECRTILWRDRRRFSPQAIRDVSEDLAELAGERGAVSVSQQLQIIARMCRTYTFLKVVSSGVNMI